MNLMTGAKATTPNAPSAQSSATGRLPGAMNLQSTIGTGTTGDWAKNFRMQQTGQQSPFQPEFNQSAMLPNGPTFANPGLAPETLIGAMWGGQGQPAGGGGQAPTPPALTPQVDPMGPFQAAPAGGSHMNAIANTQNAADQQRQIVESYQAPGPSPEQTQQDKWLQQALQFASSPTVTPSSDYDVRQATLLNGRGLNRSGARDTYGPGEMFDSYAGNPYISDAMKQSAYDKQIQAWQPVERPGWDDGWR